jgi:hypothetical protein
MSDPLDDFEIEEPEAGSSAAEDLWPEDLANLEKAIHDSHEFFNSPAQTNSEKAASAIEVLEELHPYFDHAKISDLIGQLIEILHEVCDKPALSVADVKDGRRIVRRLAVALKIRLSDLDERIVSK